VDRWAAGRNKLVEPSYSVHRRLETSDGESGSAEPRRNRQKPRAAGAPEEGSIFKRRTIDIQHRWPDVVRTTCGVAMHMCPAVLSTRRDRHKQAMDGVRLRL
jgi:hypothetical protein